MEYNPDKCRVVTAKGMYEADSIVEAVIVNIESGRVKDFVKNLTGWKDPDQTAILVHTEAKQGEQVVKDTHVFTIIYGKDGAVEYNVKSNIGKYASKYGHLPKVGDKIRIMTNSEGFGHIKLE